VAAQITQKSIHFAAASLATSGRGALHEVGSSMVTVVAKAGW
jgi:hypothetical protein